MLRGAFERRVAKQKISDEDFAYAVRNVKSKIDIQMDVGIYIEDIDYQHKPWLQQRKREEDAVFAYWERYKKYLSHNKWNSRVIDTLDHVSDDIVDLLGDPLSPAPFSRRGLIVGDVQSGKTANYTAICNKAADTGYKVIIVLAGVMENLRQQTQERLDKEFLGRNSAAILKSGSKIVVSHQYIGVSEFDNTLKPAAFTSIDKDFDINVLMSNGLDLRSLSEPVLLVVKKNYRILENLSGWLKKSEDPDYGKIDLPLLFIDDEADNASVNTAAEDKDPTKINSCIRKILNQFTKASYVGITATPFANIFINPNSASDMLADDLFPRDYIYALSPASNYIGPNQLFSDSASFENSLVPLKKSEMESFFPYGHKGDLHVNNLPQSLWEALHYFLLFNVVRDMRGDTTAHRSMMVHVSRFNAVQNQIEKIIREWLEQAKSSIRNYSALPHDMRMKIKVFKQLEEVWNKYNFAKKCDLPFETVCKDYLYPAVKDILVTAVNQRTGAKSLNYREKSDRGFRVIAIGGNSLSRGLTLEGLGVSYFYRKSLMYDTLYQMCRWFGYRDNYQDLFRIWISEEAIDWYGYITNATNELKDEIMRMQKLKMAPKDFGLKVRRHPHSLLITAQNKMRSSYQINMQISISGRLIETPRLPSDIRVLEKNQNAVKDFIKGLKISGTRDLSINQPYWRNIGNELVCDLLSRFTADPTILSFNADSLIKYIRDDLTGIKWDAVLMTDGQGSAYSEGLEYGDEVLPVKTTEARKILVRDGMILISGTKVRVGSGGCTKVGLSAAQIREIETSYRNEFPNKEIPDSAYLIKDRNPLLMLHIIESHLADEADTKVPEYLFALGLAFPDRGKEEKTVRYSINQIEYDNLIGAGREDDDE